MRIVLGAAKYDRLTKKSLMELLDTANNLGIQEIDTAPLYGKSEELIGRMYKYTNQFRINTKVGLPNPEEFSPKSINLSVERSLNLLQIQTIGTLFIHTLPHKVMSDPIRQTLLDLVCSGKVERIGYSGDSAELENFMKIESFIEDVMSTFNVLDQGNRGILNRYELKKNIYIKRPLANAVWDKFSVRSRVKLLLRKELADSEYHARFDSMFSNRGKSLLYDFFRYPLMEFPTSKVVVGVSSVTNLKKIVAIYKSASTEVNPRKKYHNDYETLFNKLDEKHSWKVRDEFS